MKVVYETGESALARVWVAELGRGRVELCESIPAPHDLSEKWVLIVSTLFGCPVRCRICDAHAGYLGKLSAEEILDQVRFMVGRRFPDLKVPTKKLKVQLARMGEPALNPAVIEVLDRLPSAIDAPGLVASLSTVAPRGREPFFEALLDVKRRRYPGRFQLQFSVHATDEALRDRLVPVPKWGLDEIARYGERFHEPGDRKITLNFAAAREIAVDAERLAAAFDPERFLVKITPINPTRAAQESALTINDFDHLEELAARIRASGFDALVSIGDLEENAIGSNCGQILAVA